MIKVSERRPAAVVVMLAAVVTAQTEEGWGLREGRLPATGLDRDIVLVLLAVGVGVGGGGFPITELLVLECVVAVV